LAALAVFAENTDALYLEAPNAYALAYADAVYNAPDAHSGNVYEADAVPFYQTVLSGCVPVFSPYLNNRDGERDILRLIDFHMYPAYVLTGKDASAFSGTNTVEIFSSRFQDWEPVILDAYRRVNEVLKHVRGQEILSRRALAADVAAVGYANGVIVVNYSDQAHPYEGTVVPGVSAMFIEGAGL
jgi:hypothetical protein